MTGERILITTGAIVLFLAWLYLAARGPAASEPATGALILRYSMPLRAFAWFTALVIPALVVGAMFALSPRPGFDPRVTGGLMLAFGVLGGLLLLETQQVRITLTDLAIHGVSPWRKPRELKWHEVQDVSFSLLNRWFIVRGASGKKIRVSCFLVGIRDFVDKVKQHVPAAKYAKAARGFKMI